MRKLILLLLLGAWLSFSASAQQYFNKREILHSFQARLQSVLEDHGRYYTTGVGIDSINYAGPGLTYPVFGLRFTVWDSSGSMLHDTVYQRADKGNFISGINSFFRLPDYSFLIAANGNDSQGHLKLFIACFDSLGKEKWIHEYDKPICVGISNDVYWVINDFKPDEYGNWIMLSNIKCNPTGNASHTENLVTKLDSSFNVIWHKSYGDGFNNSVAGHLIVESQGYTISGVYTNDNRVHKGFAYQAEIFRTDTAGTQQWHWLSDANKLTNTAMDIIHTKDGGYVYCGQGDGYQVYGPNPDLSATYGYPTIDKIDASGNPIWHRKISYYPSGNDLDNISVIRELPNGDIMAAGQIIAGYEPADTADETYGVLLRLRADGATKWKRKYRYGTDTMLYHIYDMKPTSDGGFIMAGEALDVYYPYVYPIQQAWLLKVDSNGCAGTDDPQCWAVSVPPVVGSMEAYHIYPNPVTDELHIAYDANHAGATLNLCDITGRLIVHEMLDSSAGKTMIGMRNQAAGMYLYRITTIDGIVQQGKVVKR